MPRRSSTDINQTAYSIVQRATTEINQISTSGKNPAAVALGRLGGLRGGKARAKSLSDERKTEIAKIAADARWKKKGGQSE